MSLSIHDLSSLESLREVPGIGNKTEEKLRRHFGSEEAALEAIRREDLVSLSVVPDLSTKEASRLIKNAVKAKSDSGNFLRTNSLEEIYDRILSGVREKARTKYGDAMLDLYFPLVSRDRIAEVRKWISKVMDLEVRGSLEPLKNVEPLNYPKSVDVGDRIVLTEDFDELERINEEFPGIPIEFIDDYRKLRDYVDEYESIFIIGDEFSGPTIESEFVEYLPNGLENPVDVFPELVLNFYTENLETIENSIEIYERVDAPFLRLDDRVIDKLESLISSLGSDGDILGSGELSRLKRALDELGGVVSEAEDTANERMEAALDDMEITIRGKQLRDLIEKGGEARDLVYSEFDEEIDVIIEETTDFIISELDLDYDEKDIAQDIFTRELELPLEADEAAVTRLREELSRKYSWESLETKVEYARKLEDFENTVEKLVSDVLNLDSALAVKEFAEEHGMVLPELSGKGFEFEDGINLFIDNPDPVDYKVEEVRLLTGVNSGGKTSLLDMVSQIYVLSHMGFPVPAESARVELVDNFYYYRNIKKTMSSGALENILVRFEELFSSEGSKLVLVDELENITEPGASAKIVSGILDILNSDDSIAVFVSHLADKVDKKTDSDIPVDGIEPEGLDEDMNLMVDRTPKRNLLATSTPELVVKKLASQENSRFYDKLMEKFDES